MAGNKTKVDRLHDLLPKTFNTRVNPNWSAIVDAIGTSDQNIADLILAVRKQFFVNTASRPYLDRLAANQGISRPPQVGMDDPTLRTYIPILAYQPKQVKNIIDQLLNIFFFKQTTTSYTTSMQAEPFYLKDGWELEYTVDSVHQEYISFSAGDFTDIAAATAEEVASVINKQAANSFAVVFTDYTTQKNYVQLFTNTVGSKGSVEIIGGRADIGLQFTGYTTNAGNDPTTVWTVSLVGDLVTFQNTGGTAPNLPAVQSGDIVIIDLPGNVGSFPIESVDVTNNSFSFRNLFGTAGIYNQANLPNTFVKFISPYKARVFLNDQRAVTWEVNQGEVIVEMPASPPVVRRSLGGSAHLNGLISMMTGMPGSDELTLNTVEGWPTSGQFMIQPALQIIKQVGAVTLTDQIAGRIAGLDTVYTYTGISGNTLTGITPNLPDLATSNEFQINGSFERNSEHIVTMSTTQPNTFEVGDLITVSGTTYVPETPTPFFDDPVKLLVPIEGTFQVASIIDDYTFTFYSLGDVGQASGGTVRVEKPGLAPTGSLVMLHTSVINSGITGPYMWDPNAPYTLSSATATIESSINAGNIIRNVTVSANQIPNQQGYLIFDFGTENQEGPVRYLYKPTPDTIAIDPAYVFQNNHQPGSSVVLIDSMGPHIMSGTAAEYPFYVTDPAVARDILEQLINQVASVGIFIDFLIRYPEQFYAALDVYDSSDTSDITS